MIEVLFTPTPLWFSLIISVFAMMYFLDKLANIKR